MGGCLAGLEYLGFALVVVPCWF